MLRVSALVCLFLLWLPSMIQSESKNDPPQLSPKIKAYCQTWNRDNYRTFDGKLYRYQSQCTYILAKDCLRQTFSIYTTNDRCYSGERCSTKIDVYIGMDHALSLKQEEERRIIRDMKTGELVALPNTISGLVVEEEAHYTTVDSEKLGFKLKWDGFDSVDIEIDQGMKNRTCGLCGLYDGVPDNDFYLQDNTVVTSASTFASDYKKVNLTGRHCQERAMAPPSCSNAVTTASELFCGDFLKNEFADCLSHVSNNNIDFYINACQRSYCINHQTAACMDFKKYFDECRKNGGPTIDWRAIKRDCPMQCSNGMTYHMCGCKRTCANPHPVCTLASGCNEGCYCMAGYVNVGGRCIRSAECPLTHSCPGEQVSLTSPITGLAPFMIKVGDEKHALSLPVGRYPYTFTIKGHTCNMTVIARDYRIKRVLNFVADYQVECSLIKTQQAFALLNKLAKQHYSVIKELCGTECGLPSDGSDPAISCTGKDRLTIRWPTNLTYGADVDKIPDSVLSNLEFRIRFKGLSLGIVVTSMNPPIVYPNKAENLGYVNVQLASTCINGLKYSDTEHRCV